jgi:cytochrome bd-type quinol oxidase subunit 2
MKSNTRLIIILLAVPVILLIPFVAMQFTEAVNWSMFDFLVMGILLLLIGLKIEYILRKVKRKQNRIAIISILLIVFLLIWAELAVGIFGTPFAGS